MVSIAVYDGELTHYGVKGMKWGVRRNPKKAWKKSINHLYQLQGKSSSSYMKAFKKSGERQGIEDRYGRETFSSRRKWRSEDRAYKKAWKYQHKADKWIDAMESTFRNTPYGAKSDQESQERAAKAKDFISGMSERLADTFWDSYDRARSKR